MEKNKIFRYINSRILKMAKTMVYLVQQESYTDLINYYLKREQSK